MTIKDLSAQTGYSVGTVSRVLNNQPNVSEKARTVILTAAEACGFRPNANARQLKQQHSNTILVMVKGISNELFSSLVEAIQSRIATAPYSMIVDFMDEDDNEVQRAIQICRERKPLGVLFLGGNNRNFLADFHQISQPCVLVTNNASQLPFENLSSVCSDDRQAAKMAVEHLISLGHRQIGVIGGVREISDTTWQRYLGCLDAFSAHGIPFDRERDYITVRFSYADGYRAAQALLDNGHPYTAIFAMADVMAIGAIRALQDRGLSVPADVSVIGFDGLTIGKYSVPQLATVAQSVEAMATRCVEILRGQIESNSGPCHETAPVTLFGRESVRKIAPTE